MNAGLKLNILRDRVPQTRYQMVLSQECFDAFDVRRAAIVDQFVKIFKTEFLVDRRWSHVLDVFT
jgi:hypothetical protein